MTTKTAPKIETKAAEPEERDELDAYRLLVHDPAVKSALDERMGWLAAKKKIPAKIGEDLVALALRQLWEKRNDPKRPTTLARVLGLAKTILDRRVSDWVKRARFERKHFVDGAAAAGVPAQQIDRHDQPNYVDQLPPPVVRNPERALQTKEKLEFVLGLRDQGVLTDDDIEVMEALDAGEATYDELARERGMTAGALRVHVMRVRDRVEEAWEKHDRVRVRVRGIWVYVILVLLIAFSVAIAVARRTPPPAPDPKPRVEAPRTPRGDTPEWLMPNGHDDKR